MSGANVAAGACGVVILCLWACLCSAAAAEERVGSIAPTLLARRSGLGVATRAMTRPRMMLDDQSNRKASFYNDYQETACFGGDQSQFLPDNHIVAIREDLFSQDLCGNCLKVTCIGGTQDDGDPCNGHRPSVVVVIADLCAGRCDGDLDLGEPAYDEIADENEGVIRVEYESVDCPSS